MPRAYVLLSGGIDSTTCLYLAKTQFSEIQGISIDYGQRHDKEIAYARKSCELVQVPHRVINIDGLVPSTMLTDPEAPIPDKSYAEIQGVSPTYVPYRNGLLLSTVASLAHGAYVIEKASDEWGIFFGAHSEDAQAWAYPDCTPEFIGAMANAIFIGSYQALRLHTPLEWMLKHDIIQLGDSLGVHWPATWSCYAGGDLHCGTCPTCRARREGFTKAGVSDPTEYAV